MPAEIELLLTALDNDPVFQEVLAEREALEDYHDILIDIDEDGINVYQGAAL